jgi:hypothetical protein
MLRLLFCTALAAALLIPFAAALADDMDGEDRVVRPEHSQPRDNSGSEQSDRGTQRNQAAPGEAPTKDMLGGYLGLGDMFLAGGTESPDLSGLTPPSGNDTTGSPAPETASTPDTGETGSFGTDNVFGPMLGVPEGVRDNLQSMTPAEAGRQAGESVEQAPQRDMSRHTINRRGPDHDYFYD